MAIDRIKKMTVLCPVHCAKRLNRTLHDLGTVELVDAHEVEDGSREVLSHREISSADCEVQLNKINLILSLIDQYAPVKKTFFEGLTPLPLIIDPQELQDVTAQFDLEGVYTAAQELDDTQKNAQRRITEIRAQVEALTPLEDLPFNVADLKRPTRSRLIFGTIPTAALDTLGQHVDARGAFAWEIVPPGQALRSDSPQDSAQTRELATRGDRTRIVVACLPEDETETRKILALVQFDEVPLPPIAGKVRDRIRELSGDRDVYEEQLRNVRDSAVAMDKMRRHVYILKAHWEDSRRRIVARAMGVEGKWIHVVRGYVRARDADQLEKALQAEMPDASLSIEDPRPGERVPVSITLPRLVRPVQMLVNLFGLPTYTQFDPSPFIVFNFYLFFGICFGDVGYGLMLMALGAYLAMKTRAYEGLYQFARLLFYAGVSTTIFGMLLGSWLGDLYDPKYLGEGNFLLAIKEKLMIIDPLSDPVRMLVVALAIGMLNQFYGIALKMYGAARQGDWTTAICDGLFWLIALPGMVLLISTVFVSLPTPIFRAGLAMFAVGAFGLVMTQGRAEPRLMGKITTGVVSLYGIVGSYGCTAFIGDVLSYCRLLALALTTSIVALTVNMIAGLLGEISTIGPVLFVLVLVLGHTFNFAISLLGAFVHAMRLIFVEFFGRFYEGGAKPFRPFSFDSDAYVLKRVAGSGM